MTYKDNCHFDCIGDCNYNKMLTFARKLEPNHGHGAIRIDEKYSYHTNGVYWRCDTGNSSY